MGITKDEIILRLEKKIQALQQGFVHSPEYVRLMNENARMKGRLKAIARVINKNDLG